MFDLMLCAGTIYFLSLFTGWGLCALLSRNDDPSSFFLAPWVGIAQSAFVLIMLGFLNIPASQSAYAVLAMGGATAAIARWKRKPIPDLKYFLSHAAFVLVFSVILMGPLLSKTKTLISFSTGNMDLYDYVMTADYLKDHTVKRFLTPLGQNPAWPDATLQERVVAWQVPSTRWVSYYFLTFSSVLLRRDPVDLFSLYVGLLFALFVPLAYRLAKDVLGLNRFHTICAMLLITLNPHLSYIVYHGFLPQIMGTGFLIGAAGVLPRALGEFTLQSLLLLGLFAGGVLGSYPEMFTFLLIITAALCFWRAAFEKLAFSRAAAVFFTVFLAPLFLFPYQTFRFWPMMIFNTQITGGWDVTPVYYLFFFMLGGFFSHPHFPRPETALEWATNPFLLLVLAAGILASPQKGTILAIFSPFVLAGTLSYFRDWNYRFFKNFTYGYFWLALVLNHCVQLLGAGERVRSVWGNVIYFATRAAKIILIALIVVGGAKSFEAAALVRRSEIVPYALRPLAQWNEDPAVQTVLLEGLDRWRGMWAAYYLRKKIFVLTEPNSYMRSPYKKEGERYDYVLTSAAHADKAYPGAESLFEAEGVRFIKVDGEKPKVGDSRGLTR